MVAVRVQRQQVAVDRRTFVVTSHARASLSDVDAIALEVRAAALAAIRDLSKADARALGEALIAKATPGPRPSAAIAATLQSRISQLSAPAQAAFEAGEVDIEITAKPAVPRVGGRTRAQVLALVRISARGLLFDSAAGVAVIPGDGPINVAVARSLERLGDIEPGEAGSDVVSPWRLTGAGRRALTAGLNDLA